MATTQSVSTTLVSHGLPRPSQQWLSTVVKPNYPLAAATATAKHRLLSVDFTTPGLLDNKTQSFPTNVTDPKVREVRLPGLIPVQVLGVEDLSRSRWEQVETLEAIERGEATKGREIIRVVASEDTENGQAAQPTFGAGGCHKLVLQDAKGQRVFGLELKPVAQVNLGMSIGTKIMLKDATVARGMVLLEPGTTVVLGGKIEALQQTWLENRKKHLKDGITRADE